MAIVNKLLCKILVALSFSSLAVTHALAQQLTPLTPTPAPAWGEDTWKKPGAGTPLKPTLDQRREMELEAQIPDTPEEVSDYLRRMRAIIDNYESTVMAILVGNNGLNTDTASINNASDQTQAMIGRINSTIPPAELTETHNGLASTLNAVSSFISSAPTGNPTNIVAATNLIGKLHSTLEGYHSGVLQVMAKYKISPSLDPFAGESESAKNNIGSQVGNFAANKINSLTQSFAKQGTDMMNAAGGMLNNGMSGLGNMFGGGQQSGGSPLSGANAGSNPLGLGGSIGGMSGGGGNPLGNLGSMLGGGSSGGSSSMFGSSGSSSSLFGSGSGSSGGGSPLLGGGGSQGGDQNGLGGLGGLLGGQSGDALKNLFGGGGANGGSSGNGGTDANSMIQDLLNQP